MKVVCIKVELNTQISIRDLDVKMFCRPTDIFLYRVHALRGGTSNSPLALAESATNALSIMNGTGYAWLM